MPSLEPLDAARIRLPGCVESDAARRESRRRRAKKGASLKLIVGLRILGILERAGTDPRDNALDGAGDKA